MGMFGLLLVHFCKFDHRCSRQGHSRFSLCAVPPHSSYRHLLLLFYSQNSQKPPPGDKTILEVKSKGNKHKNMSGVVQVKEERDKKRGRVDNNKTRGKGERYLMKKKAFITIVIIQAVLTFNYVPFIIAMILNGLVPPWTQKCQVVKLQHYKHFWLLLIAMRVWCQDEENNTLAFVIINYKGNNTKYILTVNLKNNCNFIYESSMLKC